MEERPGVIISIVIGVLILMFAGAYYFGQQENVAPVASASQAPTKKFRAKAGTERKNARALVSSRPSADETSSNKPVDIWGSLEKSDAKRTSTKTQLLITEAYQADTQEDGVRLLLNRLRAAEDAPQRGLIYATLATMYARLEPPMYDEAEKALRLAWEHAGTPIEKLEAAYAQSSHNLLQGDFEGVVDTMKQVEEVALPHSVHSLELGVMHGVALEGLGNTEEARAAYEAVIDEAKAVDLTRHPAAANVYRQASLNLATLLRKQGNDADADLVTIDVKRNLDF